MSYLWDQGKAVGNNDPAASPYLKTWISQGNVLVCGVTGEGTSKEIQANWDSPFEGESAGSKIGELTGGGEVTGGVAQVVTGRTSITTFQSRQVWGGNRPTQFNVVLQFYALSDPQTEVMDALAALERMASPQVNSTVPVSLTGNSAGNHFGRIPGTVMINIGRNAIYPDCVIESVSVPLDKEVNKDGLFIRAEVNLSIQTMQMLNRSDIR